MERVQLFVTCLGDLLFPDAAADAELLLRHAGFDVDFPEATGVLRAAGVQLRPSRRCPPSRSDVREGVLT